MTDMTVKIRKVPCVRAHVRTQESLLYIIRHIRHPPPLRRICNPTASSISICNALINNQETQNIFTHLKCLYSLRLDCKSNRARVIRCTRFCDTKEQKEQ